MKLYSNFPLKLPSNSISWFQESKTLFSIEVANNSTINADRLLEALKVQVKQQSRDIIRLDNCKLPKALVFDFDGTFIVEESLSEFAKILGLSKEFSKITDLAMEGKVDYLESLKERLSQLAGTDIARLSELTDKLQIRSGLTNLLNFVNKLEIPSYLVSSGFKEICEPFAKSLGVKAVFANQFVTKENKITSQLADPVIDANGKLQSLKKISKIENSSLSEIWAFGDGANDKLMLNAAGIAVGFMPKDIISPFCDGVLFSQSYKFVESVIESLNTP